MSSQADGQTFWSRKYIPLLAIVGFVAFVGLGLNLYIADQRRKETREALSRMEKLEKDWYSDVQIASATGRIALAGPVLKLREREEALSNRDVPACLAKAKTAFLAHMRASIESFTSFMADEEIMSSGHMIEATKQMNLYQKAKGLCDKSL